MRIRAEAQGDRHAIDALTRDAFAGAFEADLIVRLRADDLIVASRVAEDQSEIVGHLLLSRLDVEVDGRTLPVAALAPMAVRPSRQRQGIGTRLVRAGIDAAHDAGQEAIIVLGHPAFYTRLGFAAATLAHLTSPFSGEAWMALELTPRALAGTRGRVSYPPAFGIDLE